MGTRLYVNGNEELIAGVPTGTAARLNAFESDPASCRGQIGCIGQVV
jgi:hypothetical protein